MINRDIIRTKTVQLTYAYYQNGKDLAQAEKELVFSLSKAYHLYQYLLLLIVAITQEERKRVEVLGKRATREGTMMPSDKFVVNRFATQLETNEELLKFVETQKYTWENDTELIRKLCDQIESCTTYEEYMAAETDESNAYEADKEVWRKLYKQLIQDNEDLKLYLEDKSLYWNDDKEIVDTFVLKTIKRFASENGAAQPLLPEYKDQGDREYAVGLFRESILHAAEYKGYIEQLSQNWDISRLASMDLVIMQLAIAEMIHFPNIPIQVTITEYVQIAHLYSTPKSAKYVNGMLEALAKFLFDKRLMFKPLGKNN